MAHFTSPHGPLSTLSKSWILCWIEHVCLGQLLRWISKISVRYNWYIFWNFKVQDKHLSFDDLPSNSSLTSLAPPCCPFSMRTQGGGYRVLDSFDLLFVSREEARAWRGVNNSIANERKSKRDSLGWAMSVQLSITRRIVLRGFH